MASQKPFRIRVRTTDGRTREPNQLKGKLFPHVDVLDAGGKVEFVLCALVEKHLADIRAKLASAGLEEIPGGAVEAPPPSGASSGGPRRGGWGQPARQASRPGRGEHPLAAEDLRKKPYGFVPLPDSFSTREAVWHDGTSSAGRLSGEVRCEMENLTPLLVGWEHRQLVDADGANDPWRIPCAPSHASDLSTFIETAARQAHPDARDARRQRAVDRARQEYAKRVRAQVVDVAIDGVGRTIASKSVLCPLRAPWDDRPIVIPGDTLKGLLRHELGALLGAPMERVAERSYSYRPNLNYPDSPMLRRLEPRLARVVSQSSIAIDGVDYPVPSSVDLLPMATRNDQSHYPRRDGPNILHAPATAEPYKGGMGGGRVLPDACLSSDARRRMIHTHIEVSGLKIEQSGVRAEAEPLEQYARTLAHLFDADHGHFSARHPQVGNDPVAQREGIQALRKAALAAFQAGDVIWVEWDTKKKRVVSFGWHYYYRWAYVDTVRRRGWNAERDGLFPLPQETGAVPAELSAARRLFGYTGDNEGSASIGDGDHSQLMGRISVNAALEIVATGAKDEDRFLPPTFLKELGMPRPSAVEFYLEQPYHPNSRSLDRASLVTYGDAAGHDAPGRLAGRKFYLDRPDAYTDIPWEDSSESNRLNDRSTLALEASRPHRRFRFTVRFRDLDPDELAAVLLALCPDQFRGDVGGQHPDGYCSKLGYARPLGWGTVRVEAKELHLLKQDSGAPKLDCEADVSAWFRQYFQEPPSLQAWLDVHRHKHPNAADYPRKDGEIYTFHTALRAKHTRRRRYDKEEAR